MTAINAGTQVNLASVIFKIMMEMVLKKSTGFAVQISTEFWFTSAADGTPVTIIDSENVVALHPKPLTVSEFLAVKK